VKGQRLLQEADVVVYTGSLVPKGLVAALKATIHDSAGLTLDQVFAIMHQAWRDGKRVVRLHNRRSFHLQCYQ
jgi:precorrin-4/cobalt-precorrin-4 C11-methyltransferase